MLKHLGAMPRGWGASSHPKSEGGWSEPQASGGIILSYTPSDFSHYI